MAAEIFKNRVGDARLLVGGNWNNGASCGSRAANCNNASSNVWANNGCRGASDTLAFVIRVACALTPTAGFLSLSKGKIQHGGRRRIVPNREIRRAKISECENKYEKTWEFMESNHR